jgi:hypothetical protein
MVYGSSKPSSLSSTEAWLNPTASLLCGGEKLGGDPHISQAVCWGCSRESLFLGSSGIHPNQSATHERLLYVDHMRYVWSRSIHGSSMESVWRVGRIFPCRVYIDSNHHKSRI